jgi:hypothetical protein
MSIEDFGKTSQILTHILKPTGALRDVLGVVKFFRRQSS